MADITQLTGDYAASWLPWIMIPMICYILPFPVFAIVFLWIEREGSRESDRGPEFMGQDFSNPDIRVPQSTLQSTQQNVSESTSPITPPITPPFTPPIRPQSPPQTT